MALRVLLADESTTIKKVMQLALQDFAVEVKSVQSGIDVAEVARVFEPDVIFADVLLQKKNGYEVCTELKAHATLKTIPVILMWSSFMDLDEKLAQASGADRRLEKPFDVEHLRQLILELVPKTRSQRLAHFLQFPDNLTDPMKQEVANRKGPGMQPPPPPTWGSQAPVSPGAAGGPPSASSMPPSRESMTPPPRIASPDASRDVARGAGARTPRTSTVTPADAASLPPWAIAPPAPTPPPSTLPPSSMDPRTGARTPPQRTPTPPREAAPPREPAQPRSSTLSNVAPPSGSFAAPDRGRKPPATSPRAPEPAIEEEGLFELATDEPGANHPPPTKRGKNDANSGWSMDSFEDINEFAEHESPPTLEIAESPKPPRTEPRNPALDDDDDEEYSEFRLTPPASTTAKKPGGREPATQDISSDPTVFMGTRPAGDDRDPWSHQDLARFKLDLPPSTSEVDDDFPIEVDVAEPDPRNADFLHQRNRSPASNQAAASGGAPAAKAPPSRTPPPPARGGPGRGAGAPPRKPSFDEPDDMANLEQIPMMELDANEANAHFEIEEELPADSGLELSTFSDNDDDAEIAAGHAPARSRSSGAPAHADDHDDHFSQELARKGARIPQLSPERLEEIIRSQSREIIESVVRRIVPDLATDIIREELHRLLDDTTPADAGGRGPGNAGSGQPRRDKPR